MARFCTHCGSALNLETGLCPRCVSDEPTIRIDAPAQQNADATVRVHPVPTAAPVQEDADATMRVNPAPAQEADATTRVNRAPAPPQPASPPPATPYTQVCSEEPAYMRPPVEPAPKKKKSVGSVIASVFLSIALFVFLLVVTVQISVRNYTSESVLKDTFNKLEFSDVMDTLVKMDNEAEEKGGDLIRQTETVEIYSDDGKLIHTEKKTVTDVDYDQTFYGNIINTINKIEGVQYYNINTRKLEDVFNESTIMDYAAGLVSVYISDVLDNNKEFEISERDIRDDFLAENVDVIEDVFDIKLSSSTGNGRVSERALLNGVADAILPDDLDAVEDFYPKNLRKEEPTLFSVISLCFNWFVIIGLVLLVGLVIFLMIKNDLSQAAMGGGIVCLIVGGLFTLPGLLALIAPGIWESILGNILFGTLVNSFFTSNLLLFVIILVVGVASLVTRSIVRKRIGL